MSKNKASKTFILISKFFYVPDIGIHIGMRKMTYTYICVPPGTQKLEMALVQAVQLQWTEHYKRRDSPQSKKYSWQKEWCTGRRQCI